MEEQVGYLERFAVVDVGREWPVTGPYTSRPGGELALMFIRGTEGMAIMAWNCAPSVIGSLPHTDPAKAVDLIVDSLCSIPTWPQMPNMGFRENMYAQYARYLPGARIDEARKKIHVDLGNYDPEDIYMKILSEDVDSFSLPEDSFAGFHEFMSRKLPPAVKAVKGQVTGPVSMPCSIRLRALCRGLGTTVQYAGRWMLIRKKCNPGRSIFPIVERING